MERFSIPVHMQIYLKWVLLVVNVFSLLCSHCKMFPAASQNAVYMRHRKQTKHYKVSQERGTSQ